MEINRKMLVDFLLEFAGDEYKEPSDLYLLAIEKGEDLIHRAKQVLEYLEQEGEQERFIEAQLQLVAITF